MAKVAEFDSQMGAMNGQDDGVSDTEWPVVELTLDARVLKYLGQ